MKYSRLKKSYVVYHTDISEITDFIVHNNGNILEVDNNSIEVEFSNGFRCIIDHNSSDNTFIVHVYSYNTNYYHYYDRFEFYDLILFLSKEIQK